MAFVRRFSQVGLWFGGLLVLIAAILIAIDVLMRKFLLSSLGGADELAGYALAIGTAWSLGATLLDRAHIRIDSLYLLFPRRSRVVLDLVGLALLLVFFGLMTWHSLGVLEQSWVSGSRSQSALQTPTVVPLFLWIAGLVAFLATAVLLFLQALKVFVKDGVGGASALVGIRSAQEEVEEEIRDIHRREALN